MKKFLVIFAAAIIAFCGFAACKDDKIVTEYYYLWEYSYSANDYVISETSYIRLDSDGKGKLVRPDMGTDESFTYTLDGQSLTFDSDSIDYGVIRDGTILLNNEYYCNTKIAASPYKSISGINYAIGKDGNYKVVGVLDDKITSVEIPTEVNGTKVTAIGANAFSDCDDLQSVILNDGITEIESAAFRSCDVLNEIVLVSGIKTIGSNAFENCKSLTSIELPDGLTNIDAFAFRACSKLTEVTFPDTLKVIGFNSFANCMKLGKIEIPKSVTSVETGAFQLCDSLSEITVNPSNDVYSAVGNCLIEKASGTLIFGCKGSVLPSSGILHIAANAFMGNYAHPVVNIGEEVKTIGENAFANCPNITTITIQGSQTKISQSAFNRCSNLTSLEIYGSGVEIDRNAFFGCSQLSELSLSGVATIGASAFGNCSALTELTIHDSVKSISENAFGSCSNLTSAYIGANVIKLGMGIFQNCTKLSNLEVSEQNTQFYSQNGCIIERSSFVLVSGSNNATVPDNIRYIAGYAFKGMRVKEIVLPDTVVAIYGCAFQDCGELEAITIGSSLETISDHVFFGCDKLKKIFYTGDENSWKSIEKDPFWMGEGIDYELEFISGEN